MSEHISFTCLKHDQHSCNNIAFGLLCVASYAIKIFGDQIKVQFSQFPEDLKFQLETKIPRVLCFTNYCWNLNISCEFAKRVKKEGNIGITTKKGKAIELTHKTSGKEIVVQNTPSVLKKYKKLGYLISMPEGKLTEAQNKIKDIRKILKTKKGKRIDSIF